jgi:glycosyltransferase involved in cell wall biosynthesis
MNFSVLISVYKKERPDYLKASLESLACQTMPVGEIVLVHDGPITPELQAVITHYKQRLPLKPVYLKTNQGLSKALNAGLKECANEWVVRMDTDDVCLPERLEVTAACLRDHPEADIMGSFARIIDRDGKQGKLLRVPSESEKIRKLIWTCPMIHPTVCYRKDKILAVGGYKPEAGPRQDDYDLWYRCASAGLVFRNIPRPLLHYRFTDENIRKNSLKVGYYRMKTGFRGNRALGYGPLAYLGVTIPFFRALLPYPLNVWLYKAMNKLNPRNRES